MTDRRGVRSLAARASPPPAAAPSRGLVIAAVTHDVLRGRSIVSLTWRDDPEKKVALPVPYGCPLADIETEAIKAVRLLAGELAGLRIVPP